MFKKLLMTICLLLVSMSSYGQISPLFLAVDEYDGASKTNAITEYDLELRKKVIVNLLDRRYLPGHSLPASIRFRLPDGTEGILGWGTSVHMKDKGPGAEPRDNVFLFLKAPSGQNRISFKVSDLPENIRSAFTDKIKNAEEKKRMMVDLFNFSNTTGDGGRFFQELHLSEDRTYAFHGSSVLFYDLDYAQQSEIETLFLMTFNGAGVSELAKADEAFRKVLFLSFTRNTLVYSYMKDKTSQLIGPEEVGSDKSFIYKVFSRNLDSRLYNLPPVNTAGQTYEICLSKRGQDRWIQDGSSYKNAVTAFVYYVYSSNAYFFKRDAGTSGRIEDFINKRADEILYDELTRSFGPSSDLNTLKNTAIGHILEKNGTLTEEEIRILSGEEYFPSGLYYSVMKDFQESPSGSEEKREKLAILTLLQDKLSQSGIRHFEFGDKELDIASTVSDYKKEIDSAVSGVTISELTERLIRANSYNELLKVEITLQEISSGLIKLQGSPSHLELSYLYERLRERMAESELEQEKLTRLRDIRNSMSSYSGNLDFTNDEQLTYSVIDKLILDMKNNGGTLPAEATSVLLKEGVMEFMLVNIRMDTPVFSILTAFRRIIKPDGTTFDPTYYVKPEFNKLRLELYRFRQLGK